VSENRVLRRVFGAQREKFAGDLRRLHNEEDTCGTCNWYGKDEGKRPLERPRRRWKGNIKIYLRKIGGKL
jgi:hypothetical protein